MAAWNAYEPTPNAAWNLARAVHLRRRAGFGATWAEVQRDLRDGPGMAVARLLEGTSRQEGVPAEFESLSAVIGQAAVDSGSADRLKAWWLYRCLFSPHPLEERLTLMWHNHFATSNLKVDDLKLMKRQNATLRKFSLAPFGDLLRAMVHDPALLVWLDAPQNRQGHPNENLGRELMELFTLGIGHYSEHDVKAAARALTGCSVRQGEYVFQPGGHDDGEKEILGHAGKLNSDDLVTILLEQPATARRLAWRLTSEFFGEEAVEDAAIEELAAGLRNHNLEIRWGVETILRSERFFAAQNIGSRIADPVSFVISPLTALECFRSPPSTLVLAEWVGRMGQDLFYPPNVGGWPGGRAWLSTRTVIARTNCLAALAAGQLHTPAQPPAFEKGKAKYQGGSSSDRQVALLSELLGGQSTESSSPGAPAPLSELLSRPATHLH